MHEMCKVEADKACIMCRLSCSTPAEVAGILVPHLPADYNGSTDSDHYDWATGFLDDALVTHKALADGDITSWVNHLNCEVHGAIIDQLGALCKARELHTVFIIKPGLIEQASIIEKTICRDFEIVRRNFGIILPAQVNYLYASHVGKPYYPAHARYMSSGMSLTYLLRSVDGPAVPRLRVLLGATDPKQAAFGTLRYTYGTVLPQNGFHGSDSVLAVMREAQFFWSRAALINEGAAALIAHEGY